MVAAGRSFDMNPNSGSEVACSPAGAHGCRCGSCEHLRLVPRRCLSARAALHATGLVAPKGMTQYQFVPCPPMHHHITAFAPCLSSIFFDKYLFTLMHAHHLDAESDFRQGLNSSFSMG